MPSTKDKPSSGDSNAGTSRVRDRRDKLTVSQEEQQTSGRVRFDDKGNPVYEIRTDTPRRRKDDDTIDLLKSLENESLTLADDDN